MAKLFPIILRIACIVAATELTIMLVLPSSLSETVSALLDAGSLTLISSPLIYYLVIRPYVAARDGAELSAERARRVAEEASYAKSRFIGTISHEIRTPLNAIIGTSGLILDTATTPDHRHFAENIRNLANGLLETLNNVLDYSELDTGQLQLEEAEFDLGDVISSTLELVAPLARKKGIQVATTLGADLPSRVAGYPNCLRQVLLNLMLNVIRSVESEPVKLSVTTGTPAAGQGEGCTLCFSLASPGSRPGFALIASFEGGAGLGWEVSRRLVALMGGAFGAETLPGEVASVYFTVPLLVRTTPALMDNVRLAGMRCLIVAGAELCALWAGWLEPFGALVQAAESAIDGVSAMTEAAYAGRPFDLVVVGDVAGGVATGPLAELLATVPEHRGCRFAVCGQISSDALRSDRFVEFPAMPTARTMEDGVWRLFLKAPEQSAAEVQPLAPSGQPHRILVVQENAINQQIAVRILERAGYRVDVASDGVEAVDAVRARPYDLILMDVSLPKLDGTAATRAIRALDTAVAAIPIVALSANLSRADTEAYLAAGMNDYLGKPIEWHRLFQVVERWTRCQQADCMPSLPVSPPAPSEDEPSIDSKALGQLIEDFGTEDVAELVGAFTAETEVRVAAILEAAQSGDHEALEREAHTLKGNAGNLGFVRLAAAAGTVVDLCRTGRHREACGVAPDIETRFAQLGPEIRRCYPELSA